MTEANPLRDLAYNFDETNLVLDSDVIDWACTLDMSDLMGAVRKQLTDIDDYEMQHRIFNMALALYVKLLMDEDHAFDDISRPELFITALYQARIWETG